MSVDRAWLHQFALAVRRFSLSEFEAKNSCVVTSRLGLRVLDAFGIRARPQPVFVSVENMKALRLAHQGVPVSQWPDDAWSVAIDERGVPGGSGWDGHLVIIVREPGSLRLLIDLTADQFDRPERDLVVGGPVFMDIGGAWAPQDPLTTVIGPKEDPQTLVGYRPMPPGLTVAKSWRETADWVRDEEHVTACAARIVESLPPLP